MSGFFQAMPFVLEMEGGYVVDTGGPTMQGVTETVFHDWLKHAGQPKRPVRTMTEEERDALYYARYWVAAKCDKLPWPLSMVHFDCAVNTGVARAIKILQAAVDAKPDGVWGPGTQERVGIALAQEHVLMSDMLWERTAFYYTLASTHGETYKPYFVGWIRRVLKLRKKAIELW